MTACVSLVSSQSSTLQPSVSIAIAVDTAAVAAVQNGTLSNGVYMMDTEVRSGSKREGQINLHTKCNVGALIGYQILPIDAAGASGDTAVITAFAFQSGQDVFTGAGHPVQIKKPPKGLERGAYWIGQAMAAGTEIYEIQIDVSIGQLQPIRYFVTWTAKITAD